MGGAARLIHDNHVHGGRAYSGHSPDFPLCEVADAARAKGITVSLREHAPLPLPFLAEHPEAMRETPGVGTAVGLRLDAPRELEAYFADVAACGLSLGFEIDALDVRWLEASQGVIAELERRARNVGLVVDCFNLSHHYPWDMSFGGLQAALAAAGGPAGFLQGYFETIRTYAATGWFGAVSHLEAIRKFDAAAEESGKGPPFAGVMELYREEISRTLETLHRYGLALEYNTAGYDHWRRPFVSPETLRQAVAIGMPIVVGSDAHRPASVGRRFDDAAAELCAVGVREVAVFERRQRVMVPLASPSSRPSDDLGAAPEEEAPR